MAKKQNQTPVCTPEEMAEFRKYTKAVLSEKYTAELLEAKEEVAQLVDSLEAEVLRLRSALSPHNTEEEANLYRNISLRDFDTLTDDLRRSLQQAAGAERGLNALDQW